jgi:hypothetical protein
MAQESEKPGGFGSIPGDLFDSLINYFDTTPPMSVTLEPLRQPILVQLAKTEHAAANAEKSPYVVDVAFKSLTMQADYLTATDASKPDAVRKQAMQNILATLKALAGLWV